MARNQTSVFIGRSISSVIVGKLSSDIETFHKSKAHSMLFFSPYGMHMFRSINRNICITYSEGNNKCAINYEMSLFLMISSRQLQITEKLK